MAKSNTIGTILGSVFITLLLVGAGGYFALPALYPNLKGDYATKEDLNDLTDQGILLQTKSNKSQTAANIFWNVFTYEKIVDTGLNITTNGSSKLLVAFEAALMLRLGSTFSGYTLYNITLDISGVGNRTTGIQAGIDTAQGTDWEIPCNIYISFETEVLPAGTYSISVLWCSTVTPTSGWSQLFILSDYPRSIYAQEIAG